jgi:hypothetical protein
MQTPWRVVRMSEAIDWRRLARLDPSGLKATANGAVSSALTGSNGEDEQIS